MVILRFVWLLLFFQAAIFAQDIKISVEIENGTALENFPISGTIMVSHPVEEKVDETSFQMSDTPLKVDLIKSVKISPQDPLTISIYRFSAPGQPQGLRILPAISVKVGNKVYTSYPVTYEVKAGQTVVGGGPEAQANLKLEAYINGPTELYPGQRTTVMYRFMFNQSMDLQKEELPLLDAKGFRKIGDKIIQDAQQGAISISEIGQLIEALTPGTYTFGPSVIEGKAYTEPIPGQRAYFNGLLRGEAPEVTLTVKPFPEDGKPPSFTGGVGPLSMDVSLASPATIAVGDKVVLKIALSGEGELENLTLPDLCCLPGFSGFFKASDLPPAGTVSGKSKTFLAELRPQSSDIKAIPPVEFTYFDPATEKYVTLKSPEIPIKVNPEPTADFSKQKAPTTLSNQALPAIAITGNYPLSFDDLQDFVFGSWNVMILIPLGILLLFLQYYAKQMIEAQKKIVVPMNSLELLDLARQKQAEPKEFFYYLTRSLMRFLVEKEVIDRIDVDPDVLPTEGIAGEVRSFLAEMELQRFTGQDNIPKEEWLARAAEIMKAKS